MTKNIAQFRTIRQFAKREVLTVTEINIDEYTNGIIVETPTIKATISQPFGRKQIKMFIADAQGNNITTVYRDTQKEIVKFLESNILKDIYDKHIARLQPANECEVIKTLPSEITGEEREATRELFNNIVQIKDIKNVSPFMSKDEMDAIKSLFIRSNVKVINNVLRHMDDVKSILRSNRMDDEYDVYCTMMSKLFHTREEMQYRGEWAQLESGM